MLYSYKLPLHNAVHCQLQVAPPPGVHSVALVEHVHGAVLNLLLTVFFMQGAGHRSTVLLLACQAVTVLRWSEKAGQA